MAKSTGPEYPETDDSKHRVSLFDHTIPPEKLKPGDHIYAYRELGLYTHHGIYVGQNSNGEYLVIHGTRDNKIRKTTLDEFLDGAKLRLVSYNEDSTLLKRTGGAQKIECLPARKVVETAEYYAEHPEKWGDYDLLKNNCEHFAIFCKTGKKKEEYDGNEIKDQASMV